MTYYKSLSADGCSCHGGHSKWNLPSLQSDGTYKPGRWMPRVTDIKPCERGYHVFSRKDILQWINATLYEAEIRGETIDHGDKTVAQSARLIRPIPGCNERTLRLFACRVAEDALPLFEAQYPSDYRPRKAIETARRYALAEVTPEELAAAWAAARDAGDAAGAAAMDAAWAAADAAWAAWAVAGAAADAAWAAADAAWAAADAAAAAAADATWAAARAAARAARDAAWGKYTDWLWEAIEGER